MLKGWTKNATRDVRKRAILAGGPPCTKGAAQPAVIDACLVGRSLQPCSPAALQPYTPFSPTGLLLLLFLLFLREQQASLASSRPYLATSRLFIDQFIDSFRRNRFAADWKWNMEPIMSGRIIYIPPIDISSSIHTIGRDLQGKKKR